MNIKIRNIDFTYDNEDILTQANIRFEGNAPNISNNGFVGLPIAEYTPIANDMAALIAIVRSKLVEELTVTTV